ncbi:MAG: hypothetical protein KKD73_01735 [Proteobacteria bacterium]|nr:hypothetical protein [Pseudomonadota bacterium]MBU1640092.1 hypothetical protein [Pseudomonadota bacterium]
MVEQLPKEILEATSQNEKIEYGIRYKALINNAQAYAKESTSANLKDWDNAKAALAAMEKKLMDKYDTSEESQSKQFKTQALVLSYLKDQGYKIEKSALSNHARKGQLKKKGSVFLQKDIDDYARIHLQDDSSGEKESDKNGRALQEQKTKKEIALKHEQLLKAQMEREIMEGKYVLADKVEQELVARALVLKEGQVHTIHTYVAEWVDLVGGNQALVADMEASMVEAFAQLLHDYASLDSFELIFKDTVKHAA